MSQIKVFCDRKGDFSAYYDAEAWCAENGYSIGMMCGKLPIGILKGSYHIAKWRNLTKKEISALHGRMTGDMRNGPVTVEIY
jgi:hypothetical protein